MDLGYISLRTWVINLEHMPILEYFQTLYEHSLQVKGNGLNFFPPMNNNDMAAHVMQCTFREASKNSVKLVLPFQ